MIPPNAGERIREARERRGWWHVNLVRRVESITGELSLCRAIFGFEEPYYPPTETEWSAICAVMPEVKDDASM